MRKGAASLSLAGAIAASSCLVSIGDVESTGDGGSGGVDAGSGGSSAGSAGAAGSAGSAGSASGGSAGSAAAGGGGGAGGSGGTGGAAGASGAGGGGTSGCAVSFYEDFDTAIDGATWSIYTTHPEAKVVAASGAAHFTLPAGLTPPVYAELARTTALSLGGCAAHAEIEQGPTGKSYAHFVLLAPAEESFEFYLEGTELSAVAWSNKVQTVLATTKFDLAVNGWWRFRAAASTLYWEVSSDGSSYAPFAQMSLGFELSAVTLALGSGSSEVVTTESETIFDDIGIGP
jgi:hypothetical protein